MKKVLLTFVLLVGIVAGLFAQKLTYQAVIRDNNQQLVVNTAVKATVTITFTSGAPYQAEFNGSTNLHGLLSFEFGDETLLGRDWTNAEIAIHVVNTNTHDEYVGGEPRPVSAVPYALSVDGVAIQQYLTEHKYVTEMQVGNQIHDSISNVAGKFHTHDNMAILNATEATYTKADSLKLKGIADSAEVNVQSDWKQTDGSKDDYIKNKPSITDTVNNILSTGGYVTADALDSRHYLRSDSTVITTMQGNITANATNITSLQSGLSAATVKEKTDSTTLAGRIDALENASMDCNDVKDCIKDTLSKYTMTDVLNGLLQQLEARLTGKIDSLAHVVDSLAKLPHGGGEVADGQPCPGAKTVSDGTNTYNTVKIGNQCWMKENLRTTTKRNGAGNIYTNKTQAGYDAETYGYYYDWAAVMQNESDGKVQGICPTGWHVPSDAEWDTLTRYVKGKTEYQCDRVADNIANALSSPTGWQSPSDCGAGHNSTTLNATGFSAVPAGRCFLGGFDFFGGYAYFWSATRLDGDFAWYRNLCSGDSGVARGYDDKGYGFSVRCLRDAGPGGGGTTPVPVEVSCEQVMECMGDTLGKLNTKIENLKNTVDSLAALIPGGDTTDFTCGTDKVTDYDNNTYNTVKIGNQCWMKENLRTKTSAYGNVWTNLDADSTIYGRYYDWAAVMQGKSTTNYPVSGDKVRGICPEGWHVPSDAEWDTLTNYVNGVAEYRCGGTDKAIANALSAPTGWNNSSTSGCYAGDNSTTRNSTGFSAVPAGYYFLAGGFGLFGDRAYFWSATQSSSSKARYRYLTSFDSTVVKNGGNKDNYYSVRCLKD